MKVSEIMQRSVITVSPNTPLKEVERLIFSLGIAGVPVLEGKKLVGIVTEQDILSHMYPSIGELMDDYVHVKDFDAMEKNIANLLDMPVEKIMHKNVTTIPADTPIMRAQSLMLVRKFSRLPIVDGHGNLIGIISQGDIFRFLVRNEIPKLEKERYAGFIARHFDLMVNWKKRYEHEFPTLLRILKETGAKHIIDLGTWTGEYTIELSKKGLKVLGLDHNPIMIHLSEEKKKKLSGSARENIGFMLSDYTNLAKKIKDRFDGAICMGNALPYIPIALGRVFEEIHAVLQDRNSPFILQLLNYDKILASKERLLNFTIQKSHLAYEEQHLLIEFFDEKEGKFLQHIVIFDSDGKNWVFKGITTVPVHYITRENIEKALKKAGFRDISFSGTTISHKGDYGEFSISQSFKPLESDWLNVVARRG